MQAVLGEALSNAARHADATAVDVHLRVNSAQVALQVVDNGRGIGSRPPARRSGLANMEKRAVLLGGNCSVGPGPGAGGTCVEWVVPLEPPDLTAPDVGSS
jgi:signal transduction histidine kinase